MLVTSAFAQSAGSLIGPDVLMSILPFIVIFVIMYLLIIRPQRTQMKKREEMLKAIRRGDSIVTGGFIAKVTKIIDDNELEAEIAEGIKVRVLRSHVTDVRIKGEPVAETKK